MSNTTDFDAGDVETTVIDLEFTRRRAREMGLRLSEEDLIEITAGINGLQPFLLRIRKGLVMGQRPPLAPGSKS